MGSFRRRIGFIVLISLSILNACTTQHEPAKAATVDSSLAARLDKALRRGQTGDAHYVARVIDLKTGRELYAVDADEPVMPASNGKLAVAAAALDFFGPDHVFKTYLAIDGDDLWLIGTGDAGIGDLNLAKRTGGTQMSVLDRFADALQSRGVKKIKGNLYYYDRAFDDEWILPSWSKGYITEWYAAPISGLNFNTNCIDISVKPTKDGQPVDYTVIPPTKGVTVKNECKTGTGRSADVDREEKADVFTITGATTRPTDLKSEAIINPGAFAADALRTHLEKRGITIDGPTKRADKFLGDSLIPPKTKTIAVHETKMADALGRINKQSQNNFAEAYCKALGKAYAEKQGRKNERGSWRNGQEAVKAFLAKNKIDASNLIVADGSGLSRENRVTARIISSVFQTMWNHPSKQTYFDSLSISAVDGTIGKRLYDLKGRVRAKTGFIGGVRSLSGYVETDDGNTLVFSIIFNGIEGSVKPYEDMQDNAVRILAAWPKPFDPPASQPATKAVAAGAP